MMFVLLLVQFIKRALYYITTTVAIIYFCNFVSFLDNRIHIMNTSKAGLGINDITRTIYTYRNQSNFLNLTVSLERR